MRTMYQSCQYSTQTQCGYSSQAPINYSIESRLDYSPPLHTLEHSVETTPEIETEQPKQYTSFNYFSDHYLKPQPKQYFSPNTFLIPYRPATQFIEDAEEIEDHIKEAFEATTGKELPKNIMINVVEKEELKRIHKRNSGKWSDGIQGFALNTEIKQIFVKKNDLDKMMLVIGHEIGHVLTPTLPNSKDEEAKAFAFELAWMDAIVENNIAGLKMNINPQPANNGLHNVAFNFVKEIIKEGKSSFDVYKDIAKRFLTIESCFND